MKSGAFPVPRRWTPRHRRDPCQPASHDTPLLWRAKICIEPAPMYGPSVVIPSALVLRFKPIAAVRRLDFLPMYTAPLGKRIDDIVYAMPAKAHTFAFEDPRIVRPIREVKDGGALPLHVRNIGFRIEHMPAARTLQRLAGPGKSFIHGLAQKPGSLPAAGALDVERLAHVFLCITSRSYASGKIIATSSARSLVV
jgi:hypothetical protein